MTKQSTFMSSTCSYNCLDDLVDEAELVARIITSRWTTSASNGSIFEADKDIDPGAPRAAATSGAVEVTGDHEDHMAELVDVLATLSRRDDGGNRAVADVLASTQGQQLPPKPMMPSPHSASADPSGNGA